MICVDSSVAIKWILPEVDSELATRLLTHAVSLQRAVVAPSLLGYEVTNVLRQRMTRLAVSLATAEIEILRLLSFPVQLIHDSENHGRALAIADRFGLPAAYDAHYIAFAAQLSCEFWTADARLANRVSPELPFVRLLADWNGNSI